MPKRGKEKAEALKFKLTDKAIRALEPKTHSYFAWDTKVPGLVVRVYPSGHRVYWVVARAGGRQHRMVLEPFGLAPLEGGEDSVRARALVELGRFAEAKRNPAVANPVTARRATREAAGRALTVADLADLFEREHLPKRKPRTAAQYKTLRAHFEPVLGRVTVEAVTYDDVATFHAKLGNEHPIQANRVLAALSAMFTLAARKGLRTAPNPCRGVERFAEVRREVRFSESNLAKLGKTLAALEQAVEPLSGKRRKRKDGTYYQPNSAERRQRLVEIAAVRLLLLTGARRDEILGGRWSDFDAEGGTLRVVDHKTSRKRGPKLIVLGRAALALLEKLAAERDAANEWILPGRAGRLVGFARPWARIMRHARLSDRRPHDCRRTFASVATELGYPEAVVGELLGHTPRTVTAGYTLPGTRAMRAAADAIAGTIDALMRGEPAEQGGKLYTFAGRTGA